MPFEMPDDWKAAIFRLLDDGGCCLVTGPTDSGKSTFCLALANACIVRGLRCALVDADPGQSEIGPPCTVGLARPSAPFAAIADLEPEAIYFTGSTSPAGHLAETVSCISSAVRHASKGPEPPFLTIIDMPGLALGSQARRLLENTVRAAPVTHVVAVERSEEMRATLAPMSARERPLVTFVSGAPRARIRSASERSTRRQLKFAAYFQDARRYTIPRAQAGVSGTYLFAGDPIEPGLAAAASKALGVEVAYGERSSSHMLIVTESGGSREGAAYVAEQSRGLEAHLVSASWYRNILAALVDERGHHLALGILQSIDFERQQLEVMAPEMRAERIRQVIFGSIRVSGDGREIGRVQPSLLSASARGRR